jgi:hypothetical protein
MTARMLSVIVCGSMCIGGAAAAEMGTAGPLVRDVRVGYLMQCTFRAIRPYIWKQEPLLAGWDTDRRGGTWKSSPSGFFPNEFAFHVDWFKLHDTSPKHAVVIRRRMKAMGVDYCYAYTWGTGDVNRQRQSHVAQRDAAATEGFRMLPSTSMGWQTAPCGGGRDQGKGWAAVSDYRTLAQWAKDEFMPTLPPDSLGRRILLLANWNEFGEGHFPMPSNVAGFGYLDALRAVFTAGGPRDDAVPDERQKRRFTALFPRA